MDKKRKVILMVIVFVIVFLIIGVLVLKENKKDSNNDSSKDSNNENIATSSLESSSDMTSNSSNLDSSNEIATESAGSDAMDKKSEDTEDTEDSGNDTKLQENQYATTEDVLNRPAGDVLDGKTVDKQKYDSYAMISEIDDTVFHRINGKSYRENDDISIDELRYIKVLHYNFDHQLQVGEIIVNATVADKVCTIFTELLKEEYEIYSMHLIDDFWTGDPNTTDDTSVLANNSSAFCYRKIYNSDTLSNHAKGFAIDINPVQNPYVVFTENGFDKPYDFDEQYLDRTAGLAHMIVQGDMCYQIFTAQGFSWGGDWTNPKDYQHFEYE